MEVKKEKKKKKKKMTKADKKLMEKMNMDQETFQNHKNSENLDQNESKEKE